MLTRQGWATLLLAVVLGVIGRMFGVLELFVLGAGIGALVVATLAWARLKPISLGIQRVAVPPTLQVGETGRIEVRVTNLAPTATSPLSLWEPVTGMGGARVRLGRLGRGESTSTHYNVPATRRGTITFGPAMAERSDPFGLSAQRHEVAGTTDVIVLPAHVAVALPSGSGGRGPIGQHLRLRALGRSGTEFHSFRDYIEGDDLRRVNWRASARSETLKVREVEPDGLRRCSITLDCDADEYSSESFERAVSAAASVIASADRVGLQLRVVIGTNIDLRNTSAQAALIRLADCSPTTAGPPTVSTSAPGEGLGLSIVVTGSPASAAVGSARRGLGANDVLLVVACSAVAASPGTFVVDATDGATFARSWAAMTGTPDLSLSVAATTPVASGAGGVRVSAGSGGRPGGSSVMAS